MMMKSSELYQSEEKYMNKMQLMVNCVDANSVFVEVARAGGKTDGVLAPRIIRVAESMPGEVSFLIHKTYVALLTNIVPNIRAVFNAPTASGRPLLEEGVHYVVGTKDLPSHFRKPRRPISDPKRCIVFCDGHVLLLTPSDMPEASAGLSAVHAFVEEMKLQKGERLKSRIFPALRGATGAIRQSPYYLGITGVSDTARIDLGEDNWFEKYEENMDPEVINDIINVALHRDKFLKQQFELQARLREETNPLAVAALQKKLRTAQHGVGIWTPILNEMKRNATLYVKASSFVNKDFLGPKFFQTQYETLSEDEFLSSICNVRIRRVVDPFFATYNPEKHRYSDSYRHASIMQFGLNDEFKLTAFYLKYFKKDQPIYIGYDPGSFQSMVVAQADEQTNNFRILKEFFVYSPRDQVEMAQQFAEFFGPDYDKSIEIQLYYDRAGNKRKEEQEQISTDAKILKRELESHGFRVALMNEEQRTIYHYEHYKLLMMLFCDRFHYLPHVSIDENECPNLVSAIPLCAKKKNIDGRIELDKSPEVKVAMAYQAGLTPQIPSALMYLLFGKFSDKLPSEMNNIPDLPDNVYLNEDNY